MKKSLVCFGSTFSMTIQYLQVRTWTKEICLLLLSKNVKADNLLINMACVGGALDKLMVNFICVKLFEVL